MSTPIGPNRHLFDATGTGSADPENREVRLSDTVSKHSRLEAQNWQGNKEPRTDVCYPPSMWTIEAATFLCYWGANNSNCLWFSSRVWSTESLNWNTKSQKSGDV